MTANRVAEQPLTNEHMELVFAGDHVEFVGSRSITPLLPLLPMVILSSLSCTMPGIKTEIGIGLLPTSVCTVAMQCSAGINAAQDIAEPADAGRSHRTPSVPTKWRWLSRISTISGW